MASGRALISDFNATGPFASRPTNHRLRFASAWFIFLKLFSGL